jgi:uncharacterized membrane protein YozB (DUF420 family)
MKQNPLVSYITKLSILSIIVCFIGLFALFFLKDFITTNLPYYIVMFYLCTLIGYLFVYFSIKKGKMKFENIFMITKFGKLLVYIIVFLIVLWLKKESLIPFTITYLVLYVIYLVFDTLTLKNFSKKI